jgi:hypothetical protein
MDTVYVSLYERRRQPDDDIAAGSYRRNARNGGDCERGTRKTEGSSGCKGGGGDGSGGGGVGRLVESEEEPNLEHPYCRYEHIFVLDQSRLDADIGDKYDEDSY